MYLMYGELTSWTISEFIWKYYILLAVDYVLVGGGSHLVINYDKRVLKFLKRNILT